MVTTPKMRHSKSSRKPLTIDLDADSVARVDEENATVDPADTASADAVDISADAASSTHLEKDEPTAAMREPSGYRADETPANPSATEEGAAVTAASPSSGDEFSRIVASIIGAIVALAIAAGLQYAGVLGSPGASGSGSNAQAQIDELKQQIAAIQAAPAAVQEDAAPQIAALSSSLDAVKADVAALKESAGSGSAGGDVAALLALDERVKAVEAVVASAGQPGAVQDPAALAALSEKVAAVEATAKAAGDSATQGGERIARLEQTVATLAGKVDGQAAQPKVALSIATAALQSAIERGAPFLAELETLAALGPENSQVTELRPYAEKGVASHAALVEEVGPAADAMVAADTPIDTGAGFFDRLLHSAESLVAVRPIGTVEGTSVGAIVARMEVAVRAGDLNAAVAEFDTLPDPVKQVGGAFAEKLKARQAVETLADQAVAAAMKA